MVDEKIVHQVAYWLASCQVGISSKTMALWLAHGLKNKRDPHGNHPHDPDDLDRCLQLLEIAPGLRPLLPRMAEISPEWAALVARWDEIERSHLDEVGLGWTKVGSAPKTYKLMRSIIESARRPANA